MLFRSYLTQCLCLNEETWGSVGNVGLRRVCVCLCEKERDGVGGA